MIRETSLSPADFVYPMFICPGEGVRKEVRSMPGVFNLSVDQAIREAREVHSLGVPSIILFGLPEKKDDVATGAWADDGIVQQAARAIKRELPALIIMGDVCLCEYMSHGHCGIVHTNNPWVLPRRLPPLLQLTTKFSTMPAWKSSPAQLFRRFAPVSTSLRLPT